MTAAAASLGPGLVPPAGPTRTVPASGAGNEFKARQAAESFEALFLTQVLETMNTGLSGDNPFSGGSGERIYQSLMNQEIAAAISRSGGIGVADVVFREIMRQQEMLS